MTTFSASILADSITPGDNRLTTMEVTFPRTVLAEFNTHRVFSRNSASSRAIPVSKMIRRVLDDPFVPSGLGVNQSGMVAGDRLPAEVEERVQQDVLVARDRAVVSVLEMLLGERMVSLHVDDAVYRRGFEGDFRSAETLLEILSEVSADKSMVMPHKEMVNRYLEPWLWHTVVVTASEWENFFVQRCHPDADPKIRLAAEAMREALVNSAPVLRGNHDYLHAHLGLDDWHLPFVSDEDRARYDVSDLMVMSVARCARVSYDNHHKGRDLDSERAFVKRLWESKHCSPFEHVAVPEIYSLSWHVGSKTHNGWVNARALMEVAGDLPSFEEMFGA